MAITKGGVYYDLDESVFEFTYVIRKNECITFTFSSMSHLRKFQAQVKEFVEDFNITVRRKYGMNPNMKGYPAIILYSRLETRGFKIYWHRYYRSMQEVEHNMKEGVLNG